MPVGTLLPVKFRTPKGEDYDVTGETVTISAANTWTTSSGSTFAAKGLEADLAPATGKIEPNSGFAQKTKMRFKGTIPLDLASGSITGANCRLYDAANGVVLAESVEGAQALSTTPANFTFDSVAEVDTDADIVIQVRNNQNTTDIVVNTGTLAVWHP